MALDGPTMVPGVNTRYSQQAVCFSLLQVSSSSSLCLYPSVSCSLLLIHHLLTHLSGIQDIWVSKVVSGVVLGVLCPACVLCH